MSKSKSKATDLTPPPTIEETTPASPVVEAVREGFHSLTPQQLLGGEPDADAPIAAIPPEEIEKPTDDAGAEIRRGSGGKTICSKCGKHRPFDQLLCECAGSVRLDPMSEQLPAEPRHPPRPAHLYGRMPVVGPLQFFGADVPSLREK